VTLVGVALLPAECAFTYYGFTSLLDQTRFINHFDALRGGIFAEIRYDNIEGLISFPSFHTAGGLMVTWAMRHHRAWLVPVFALNVLLISATVLTGAHYAIDVVVTAVMFAGSVWLWRAWGSVNSRELGVAGSAIDRNFFPPQPERLLRRSIGQAEQHGVFRRLVDDGHP
jgi:hypothetical protein